MNWYVAKLVFRIERPDMEDHADFDEQYRLVLAADEESAFARAKIIGVKNEQIFEGADGASVRWHFIDTAFVRQLDELADGVELFSSTLSSEHPSEYEAFVHHQAELAFQRMTPVPHAVVTD